MEKNNSNPMDMDSEKRKSLIEKNQSWKPKKISEKSVGADGKNVAQEVTVSRRTKTNTVVMSVVIFICLMLTVTLFIATKLAIGNNMAMMNRRNYIEDIVACADDMVVNARYYVASKESSYYNEYSENYDKFKNIQKSLDVDANELGLTDQTKRNMQKLEDLIPKLAQLSENAFNISNAGDLETANKIIYGDEYRGIRSSIKDIYSEMVTTENDAGVGVTNFYGVLQNVAMFSLAAFVVITLILEILNYISIRRHIVIPLGLITELYTAIADGDLEFDNGLYESTSEIGKLITESKKTQKQLKMYMGEIERVVAGLGKGDLTTEIEGQWVGDYGEIKIALESILDILNNSFGTIIKSSDVVSDEANEVANLATTLSQASTEQAATIEEISASIVNISEQIKETDENAAVAAQKSQNTRDVVEKGTETMQQLSDAMGKISSSSAQIGKIIKAIDDIAFQTNILALNAAVEAARAGTHGKGFAVVADEVRNLALKSSNAAKDTTILIQNSINSIEEGTKIAAETAEIFKNISIQAEATTELANKISHNTRVQASTIDEISISMEQISNVVQTTSATSEESAASSEDLSSQAKTLTDAANYFKLREKVSL